MMKICILFFQSQFELSLFAENSGIHSIFIIVR